MSDGVMHFCFGIIVGALVVNLIWQWAWRSRR